MGSFFQSAPYSYLLIFLKCNYNFLERKSTHQLFPTVYCKRKMENVRTFRRKSETFKIKKTGLSRKVKLCKGKVNLKKKLTLLKKSQTLQIRFCQGKVRSY